MMSTTRFQKKMIKVGDLVKEMSVPDYDYPNIGLVLDITTVNDETVPIDIYVYWFGTQHTYWCAVEGVKIVSRIKEVECEE